MIAYDTRRRAARPVAPRDFTSPKRKRGKMLREVPRLRFGLVCAGKVALFD